MSLSIVFLPTTPYVIINAFYKRCLQRILMYVAEKGDEIRKVVYRLALESLLKEMSYSSILVINLLFVNPSQYNVIDSAI